MATPTRLTELEVAGVPVIGSAGPLLVTGKVFHVDNSHASAADSSRHGTRKDRPFKTIDYAIGKTTANKGDVILVGPDHDETVTVKIAVDVAGIAIIGVSQFGKQPSITNNFAGDTFDVSAADCAIVGLRFVTPSNASGININIAAAGCLVAKNRFELGANAADCITITADGDDAKILDNLFIVTANGPAQAIAVEGAADSLVIRGNIFNGGSTTNEWDDAAIDFAANTPINVLIEDNTFIYGDATVGTGNVLKSAGSNRFYRGARPKAGVKIDIYADASGTTTGSGTEEDPTTLTDAINLAEAGDRVLLYPGVFTVTAAVAMDVAGMILQPVDYVPGQRICTVEIANDTDDINTIDVTAARCVIQGILFTKGVNNTTDGTELIDVNAGGDYLTIRDCVFDMEARSNADCINIATGLKGILVENCFFTDLATGKSAISSAASSSEYRNNVFDGTAGDFIFFDELATPGAGSAIHHNLIISDGAAGAAAGNLLKLQATPGKNAYTYNDVFDSGADVDSFGDDADGDPLIIHNSRDGAATGARTDINPSVT